MILGSNLCLECETRPIENRDTGLCASCGHARRKSERLANQPVKKRKAIPKFSKKRKDENTIYSQKRLAFLDGKECPVNEGFEATEIHHMKGRQGYADQWAKDCGITLLLDERYWLAVSASGHRYIELHPQEAKDMGWSLSRLENLDQEPEII